MEKATKEALKKGCLSDYVKYIRDHLGNLHMQVNLLDNVVQSKEVFSKEYLERETSLWLAKRYFMFLFELLLHFVDFMRVSTTVSCWWLSLKITICCLQTEVERR
jgi:hypothetical protein